MPAPEWWSLTEVVSAAGSAARPVGWRDGRNIDRGEFLQAVAGWQAAFAAQGGLDWALLLDDPVDFAAALFGAWHAGKRVFLPADAQPATVTRLRSVVNGMAGDLPGGLRAGTTVINDHPRQRLDAERVQLVLFTSGSSGEPLAISKRLAQLEAEVRAQQQLFGQHWIANSPLTVHATVSHQHIYGLLFVVLWPLAAGCRIDTRRIAYAEEMVKRLAAGPCLLVSSPAHLKRLPENLDWQALRGSVQAVLSSGGPLPVEAALRARQCFGNAPIEIYGSSETGGVAWRQRVGNGTDDRWTALPGVEWRIEAEVLQLRSPFLADAGWYVTEDRVRADASGGFTLLGRADRIAKIEERRVSLSAIERSLLESPLVAEVKVLVMVRDAAARTAAVVVPSDAGSALLQAQGRRAMSDALRAAIASSVDRVAWPRQWRYVNALPVNTQGKVTEADLQRLFDDHEPDGVRWLEQGPTQARVELVANEGHAAFAGHFPAAAILPGVVQLDWAINLARQAFAIAAPVCRLEVLKFQAPVLPGLLLEATLEWDQALMRLMFQYRSSQGKHASGRVIFGQLDV